jgi:hypothetical protein
MLAAPLCDLFSLEFIQSLVWHRRTSPQGYGEISSCRVRRIRRPAVSQNPLFRAQSIIDLAVATWMAGCSIRFFMVFNRTSITSNRAFAMTMSRVQHRTEKSGGDKAIRETANKAIPTPA